MMRRAMAALAIAAVMVLGARGVLLAHATLVSSEPAANATLPSPPARVRLLFDEEIEPTLARVEIVAANSARTSLHVVGDPHDVHAVIAPVNGLSAGAYRIVWRVVSADGHPVEGTLAFAIGLGAAAPEIPASVEHTMDEASWGPTVSGAPIVPAILRGLGLAALMAVTGLLFFERGAPASRVALGLSIASAIILVLHFLAWMINAAPDHALDGATFADMSGTLIGKIELARVVLAVLVCWALWLARRPALALGLAVLAVIVSGGGGHAAGIHPLIAMPAKAVHLLAVAIWLGGLLHLLRVPADAPRVSSAALVAVIVVLATGLIQTVLFVSPLGGVLHSGYGADTLAKCVGLLVLICFGAYHRYRGIPRMRERSASLSVSLRAELAVMLIVILLGGLLAYVPTPHST